MNPNSARRRAVVAALCATAALGLSACGGDDKPSAGDAPNATATTAPGTSPTAKPTPTLTPSALAGLSATEIINKATTAMKGTHSLTADMKAVTDGKPMTFHMSLDTKGQCTGEMVESGAHVKIISTSTHFYLQGDDAFLTQMGEGTKQLLGGKWMKTGSKSETAKEMGGVCDLDELLSGFKDKPTTAKKGALTTLDGKRVITITDKDPKDGAHETSYIAADGTPYVLKVVTSGGKEPGTLLLSDFDEPVHVGAPPASQIVDIDKLGS